MFQYSVIAMLAALAVAAETLSPVAGTVTASLVDDAVAPLSCPFETTHTVASMLNGDANDGELLHVWTGNSFNVYQLTGGQWRIYGTQAAMPAGRIAIDEHGAAWMRSRSGNGTTTVQLYGGVPEDDSIGILAPPQSWQLLAYPWPVAVTLNSLAWTGAADGDQVKIWDAAAADWETYDRVGGAWQGNLADPVIEPATAFLYYNSGTASATLTFDRPF
ncbi:MAG: hypothetical protein QGF67_13960 [Lentisphaeria bacterium]|jgi:hypothetical protein|nr:hypothetical protein [Lentisphaeria bacterium]MDP7742543.1 hypothetical protein [Lentisphaeria bacterium]